MAPLPSILILHPFHSEEPVSGTSFNGRARLHHSPFSMASVNTFVQDFAELLRLQESIVKAKRRHGYTDRVPGSNRFKECKYCVPGYKGDVPDTCPCSQIALMEYHKNAIVDRLLTQIINM